MLYCFGISSSRIYIMNLNLQPWKFYKGNHRFFARPADVEQYSIYYTPNADHATLNGNHTDKGLTCTSMYYISNIVCKYLWLHLDTYFITGRRILAMKWIILFNHHFMFTSDQERSWDNIFVFITMPFILPSEYHGQILNVKNCDAILQKTNTLATFKAYNKKIYIFNLNPSITFNHTNKIYFTRWFTFRQKKINFTILTYSVLVIYIYTKVHIITLNWSSLLWLL